MIRGRFISFCSLRTAWRTRSHSSTTPYLHLLFEGTITPLVLTDEESRDPPLLHITYILVTIPALPSSLLSYPHLNILAFIIHIVNTLSG